MTIKEKLTQDLKTALRTKNDVQKRTIRMAISAIKDAEIAQRTELDDAAVTAILQKQVKMRREAIDGAQKAGRDDLIAAGEAELAVLQTYLPAALSPAELETLVAETIAETGATSMREMGKVMQAVLPKLQGRADGKAVSQVVRRLLM
jgi:uncharacterized protein YqeY